MGYTYPIQYNIFGCLIVEKYFLRKVKGMDDQSTMRTFHLCVPIFEFLVQTPVFKKLYECGSCMNGVHVPHSVRGFWLFTGLKNLY